MNAAPARASGARRTQRLRVLPPPAFRAPRTPFVIVIVAILAAGLVGLLLLNTALAQGSFRMHDLQRQTAALQDREEQLQVAVDAANDPARLAAAAHHLGLVPAEDPGFIRLSDGRLLGAPVPATAPPKKVPPSTSPSPQASGATAATKPTTKPTAKPTAKPAPHATAHPTPAPPGHGGHG